MNKHIKQAQEAANTLNTANEVGVLMSLLCEKLEIVPSKTFWQDLIQKYQTIMSDQKQAQDVFADLIDQGKIPTTIKEKEEDELRVE